MIGTASELERLLACPASAVLPHSTDRSSEHAERGTAIHRFLEAAACVGRDEALAHVPGEYLEICELIDADRLPFQLSAEVAFVHTLETGITHQLAKGTHRDYGNRSPSSIAGTADVVGINREGIYAADYKTGYGDVTKASANPQLHFLAFCACRVYDKDRAIIEIIRLKDPGNPWYDRAELDAFDLARFGVQLQRLWDVIEYLRFREIDQSNVTEGAHCKYCPAFDACPAKMQLATSMSDESLALEVESTWAGGLTERTAPDAYRKWQLMKQLTKRAGEILYSYAKKNPIDLSDGRVFGERTKNGNETLNGDIAWSELERLYGLDVANAAVTRSATKAGIEKALRAVEDDDSLAARKRKVLAAIRQAGGADRKERTVVEEYEI